MDTTTPDALLNAVEMAKEGRRKLKEKEAGKYWPEIDVPLPLTGGLSLLTKQELDKIRKNLDVKKASHLNKQDLIAELANQVPEKVEKIFRYLDTNRYRSLVDIVANGGWVLDPGLEAEQLDYLRQHAMVFSGSVAGQRVLVMPQEISEAFRQADGLSLQSLVQRNTEWVRLIHGLLYYYGTLTHHELVDMIEKYTGEKTGSDLIGVLFAAMSYYRQIKVDAAGFSTYRVWDGKRVKQEHQARPDVDFYPFSKEQLLKAGEPDFVDRHPAYLEFVQVLVRHFYTGREKAEQIAEECVYAAKIGEPMEHIVEYLQSQMDFRGFGQVNTLLKALTNMMNHTRQWFLKGYSPAELLPREQSRLQPLPPGGPGNVPFRTEPKVGRNDPCPCGSNRKYKKCCGK